MSDYTLEDRLWEAQQPVSSLGAAELRIYIMQEGESAPTERQLETLGAFKDLPPQIMDDIASHAVRYCQHVDSIVDLADEGIEIDIDDIRKHFTITALLIPELDNCESDFVFVSADCDWEPERGMQLLVENGRVIWCGEHGTVPFSPQWKEVIASSAESRKQLLEELLT